MSAVPGERGATIKTQCFVVDVRVAGAASRSGRRGERVASSLHSLDTHAQPRQLSRPQRAPDFVFAQ